MSSETLAIPLVDVSNLQSRSYEERVQCGKEILGAFQSHGFLYIKNHPIPEQTIQEAFERSKEWFARPQEEKLSIAWDNPDSNRGFTASGREKTSTAMTMEDVAKERESAGQDLKESLEIGREHDEKYSNRWLEDESGLAFKSFMQHFWADCAHLNVSIMRAIALGLGIIENFFEDYFLRNDNTLRLLHYPAVSKAVFQNKNQVRAGAHTDYGALTLLFQNRGSLQGGLEVLQGGKWCPVTPVEGAIVVNAGDLMARWSNDYIKSTMHRVVEPTSPTSSQEAHPARYSIAYFANPDFDREIDTIPGLVDETKGSKYSPVNAGAYLKMRLEATY